MHQEIEETQKLSRWGHSGDFPYLKKAFDHEKHSFATPQHYDRKGYQSTRSRYSTKGGPRATLQSAWRGSPVTNASLSSGVSHKEPQSRRQSLWLFLVMSWRTWMLRGETETLVGKWTTSTQRALLSLTTSLYWRQAKKMRIDGFLAAGLETGLDKTFWTSTTRTQNATLNVDGHTLP